MTTTEITEATKSFTQRQEDEARAAMDAARLSLYAWQDKAAEVVRNKNKAMKLFKKLQLDWLDIAESRERQRDGLPQNSTGRAS